MKKFLKIVLIVLAVVVIVVIGFVSFIAIRGIPKFETQKIDLKIESTPERVAQGKKLANMLCVKCHLSSETNKLTGKLMGEAPKAFGEIYSRNITQHTEKGIGSWTDGEISYLLRTGIRKDGHYSPPYMAKLPHISDEDIASIISWLHSDDPMLAASDVQMPEPKPSFLVKFLCFVAFKPFEYPTAPIAGPDKTNPVAWGKYIANAQLDCYTCHSADFKTDDFQNPEKSIGFYGGGNHMNNENGTVEILTANITMDKATGIGNWTEEDFITTLKYGKRPNGEPVKYPMEPYALLDSAEVKAIFAYLKTVPPLDHKVNR
jgi:mono/diheme cytochrome c family protein